MVFGAMQYGEFIVEPIRLPANAHDLDLCLKTMVDGFKAVRDQLDRMPAAISFAFPGPADYPNGIIGGYLPNFPSFRDGVALGPFLRKKFGIPVYINNDGDLFAYGEALGGILPDINERLELAGSSKRYKNLLGYTFGTGFGMGMIVNGMMNRGDNSCVETWCLPHAKRNDIIVEEGVSIRAVTRVYGELAGFPDHGLTPKDICDIALDFQLRSIICSLLKRHEHLETKNICSLSPFLRISIVERIAREGHLCFREILISECQVVQNADEYILLTVKLRISELIDL